MINIQFMTEEQAIIDKHGKKWYVPDFDALVENACCAEEVAMLREVEERIKGEKPLYHGFAFPIVYTDYAKALVFNEDMRGQHWTMKWQIMQHPWYECTAHNGAYGKRYSKEQMINEIAQIYCMDK